MTGSRAFLWASIAIAAVGFVGAVIAGGSMAARMRGKDDDESKAALLLAEALEKLDKGDVAGSRSLTERVLAIVPADPLARANLGRIYKTEGDHERAIAEHKLALASDAELPDLYYNIACYYALMKRPDDAFTWLALALDHGFARLEHLRGDADLESLRKDPRFDLLARTGKLVTGVPRVRFHPSRRRIAIGEPFEISLVVERDVPLSDVLEAARALTVEWKPGDGMEVVSSSMSTTTTTGDGFVTLRTTGRWVVRGLEARFHVLPEARVSAVVAGKEIVVSSDTYGVTVEERSEQGEGAE